MKKKIAYWFDNHLSHGATQQFMMLFAFILLVMLVFGFVSWIMNGTDSVGKGIWESFLHLLDPGTISGTEGIRLIVPMAIVTVIGLVFTGMLISIINNALEEKLSSLRKGHSQIAEKYHTVVFGCNDDTYSIISEQIEANRNVVEDDFKHTNPCVVVIEDLDKEEMDNRIKAHIPDFYNTRIICRSGKLTQENLYETVALEEASSIIIRCTNDLMTLRIALAVGTYLRKYRGSTPHITTMVNDTNSMNAVVSALEGFDTQVFYFDRWLARITAQACRQPGLSYVFTELFNYEDAEIYVEERDHNGKPLDFTGVSFKDAIGQFTQSTLIGVVRKDSIDGSDRMYIAPKPDFEIQQGDKYIVVADDDNMVRIDPNEVAKQKFDLDYKTAEYKSFDRQEMHLLILSWNKGLPEVLTNLDDFASEDSTAKIVAMREYKEIEQIKNQLKNIDIDFQFTRDLYDKSYLEGLITDDITNILLLCRDDLSKEDADAQTMMILLQLRGLIRERELRTGKKRNVVITSELNISDDQKLMQLTSVDDFIVGSEIANRIITQVANVPVLKAVFEELLTAAGADFYLRSISNYLCFNEGEDTIRIEFRDLVRICYEHGDIVIGWLSLNDGVITYKCNPDKSQMHSFRSSDKLIIISQVEYS
ncbi:MAG: hypothetical protein IJ819_04050 [Clostridiales bacterium]|nr:hypothetical protein [Clostridiales bacterium]